MADQKALVRKKAKSFARPSKAPPAIKPTYDVPKWTGKPPSGMHLDVSKGEKLIEKFIVDGKTHFFFGRQREYIDFMIDHTSCSRVHAVIVYHKHLQRMFLVDLGSTHGTFMGSTQLEANRPMQLAIDETFSFGASTRTWTLREKPTAPGNVMASSLNSSVVEGNENDTSTLSLLGLPEAEHELNDLTEFNTAHNRRIATLPIDEANLVSPMNRKRKKSSMTVSFDSAEDAIINPEDVDPTIGRFRNLISTEIVIPHKKGRSNSNENIGNENTDVHIVKTRQEFQSNNLYNDLSVFEPTSPITTAPKITSAPDVEAPDFRPPVVNVQPTVPRLHLADTIDHGPQEPTKKKYIKEAWPGRKPKSQQNLLSV